MEPERMDLDLDAIKSRLREIVDALKLRNQWTHEDLADRLGVTHYMITNCLNPRSPAMFGWDGIDALAELAKLTKAEREDLVRMMVLWKLGRRNREVHARMLGDVPKTRIPGLLDDLAPMMRSRARFS